MFFDSERFQMIVKKNNLLKLTEILEEGFTFVHPESGEHMHKRPDD